MIAEPILAEFGAELEQLESLGYRVDASKYDPDTFGNWYVDLVGPRDFRVVRDRGQYYVRGDRASLERFDLWRAYDDQREFADRLVRWASR